MEKQAGLYKRQLSECSKSLNKNKLKKIGLSSDKSEDGNIYLSKGDYTLNINGFSRNFSIK